MARSTPLVALKAGQSHQEGIHMENPSRKRVGLALGGGVVRGMAHLGVLMALERGGIPIDIVTGTSVGSLIGAFYSTGRPIDELIGLANGLGWRHMIRPVIIRDGFFSFAGLEKWLVRQMGDLHFSDLARPFAAVASDIDSWRPIILREGRVAPAVRASCSVPGLIQPVEIGGRRLADGGITDNVPVDAARLLGADYVIGVNIFGGLARKRRGPMAMGFAALETMVRWSGGGLVTADCLISPAIDDLSYVRFAHRERLIELGIAGAEEKLPEIRAALSL
jgi:NTE family protein